MDPMLLVGVTVGAVGGGAFFAWYFGRERRTRSALVAAPIVKVGDVRQGDKVRVTGKLKHGPMTLDAPFSHRQCAHYDAILEERYLEEGKEAWSTVAHETSARPFFVADETGEVQVDTTRFEAVVVRDHHKHRGDLDRDKALAFLTKHGHAPELPADRVLRYREGVLEAGETVTILGTARFETHDGKKVLVIGAADGSVVRASDDPDLVR